MDFGVIDYKSPKNFFEETKKQITHLAYDYNENTYSEIIHKINAFILHVSDIITKQENNNKSQQSDSSLMSMKYHNMSNEFDVSEYNATNIISDHIIEMYKQEIFNVVLLLSNYNEMFYNIQTKSMKYTLDLLLRVIQTETIFNYTSLESSDIILSIIYKIYISLKQLNENEYNDKYIKKCIEVLKAVNVPDNNIVNALQLKFQELIDSNNNNNNMSLHNANTNNNDDDSCDPLSFIIEKSNIKKAFENFDFKIIDELYRTLERESNYINRIETNKFITKQELLTNNLKTYMYFMKQILTHIDKHTTNNTLFQQLFFNLIIRNKTFMCYFQKCIAFSYSKTKPICLDKEIFIEKHYQIGDYIFTTLNLQVNDKVLSLRMKILSKIITPISSKIQSIINNNKPLANVTFDVSTFHLLFYILTRSNSHISSLFNVIGYVVYLPKGDEHVKFGMLCKEIKECKRDFTLQYKKENNFVLFSIDKIKGASPMLYIENNTKDIQRCTELASIIVHANPINIFLYIAIKLFMVNNKLFFEYSCPLEGEQPPFDDCVLLYFVYYYLIHEGILPAYNEVFNKDTLKLSLTKLILHKDKCNLSSLGKLYVNFFYFLFTFTQNALEYAKQGMIFINLRKPFYKQIKNESDEIKYIRSHPNVQLRQTVNNTIVILETYEHNSHNAFFYLSKMQVRHMNKASSEMLHVLLNGDYNNYIISSFKKLN